MSNYIKVIIVVFLVVISVVLLSFQVNRTCYQPTTLLIEIVSGQSDKYQVYYDTGRGYNEKESVEYFYSGLKNQRATFLIPYAKFSRFRIDPGSKNGIVRIQQICMISGSKFRCWKGDELLSMFKTFVNITDQHIEHDMLVLNTKNNDPCFEYNGTISNEIKFELNLSKVIGLVCILLVINALIVYSLFFYDHLILKINIASSSKFLHWFVDPKKVFLFFAITGGMITIFVTPPLQVPDEQNHFFRAYQIASGKFVPETRNDKVGGFIPIGIVNFTNNFNGICFHAEKKTKLATIYKSLNIPLNSKNQTFAFFPNTGSYSPVSYIPQSLAIITGNLFNAPPLILMYLGRISNLLCWIILISLAINVLPGLKWLFVVLALSPMSLFQASSLSADVVTNGCSFLFIAVIFRLAFDKNASLNKKNLYVLIILLVLISLSKYAYSFLFLLYFLIPVKKSGTMKNYLVNSSILLIITGATVAIASYMVNQIYQSVSPGVNYYGYMSGTPMVNPILQLQYIITQPFTYVKTILFSLWTGKSFLLTSFIGNLGWLDTPLPDWFIIFAFTAIGIIALGGGNKEISIPLRRKFILLVCAATIIISLSTLLYLSWTPVGSPIISGLQGRYFIPVAPVVFTLFYNRKWIIPEHVIKLISISLLSVSFAVMIMALSGRYYGW